MSDSGATQGTPRVINGIHFVWVPEYPKSRFLEHWLSVNGKIQVRVYKNGKKWAVCCHELGASPDINDECPQPIDHSAGWTEEDEVFSFAAQYALNGKN